MASTTPSSSPTTSLMSPLPEAKQDTVLVSQNVRRGENGEVSSRHVFGEHDGVIGVIFVELTFQHTDHDVGNGVPFVQVAVE